MSNCEHVLDLLQRLNELERRHGRFLAERDPNFDPSGEANARAQVFEDELRKLGATLHWNGWHHHLADPWPVLRSPDECALAGQPLEAVAPLLGHAACLPGNGVAAAKDDTAAPGDSTFVLRFAAEGEGPRASVQLRVEGRMELDRFLRVLRGEPADHAANAARVLDARVLEPGTPPPGPP
jgi:hypothetical protein